MTRSRAGLSTLAVVDAALEVLDEGGPEALTLAAVAAHTGVATPSLYKHVGSLAELRALVGVRVLDQLTAEFTAAVLGRSGDDAVAALMRTHRAYAARHPARYAAMPLDPLHHPLLADAGARLLAVFVAALRDYGLSDSAAVHAVRCLRSAAHGFAALEVSGGFGMPENLDESYEQLIRMVLAGLSAPVGR